MREDVLRRWASLYNEHKWNEGEVDNISERRVSTGNISGRGVSKSNVNGGRVSKNIISGRGE